MYNDEQISVMGWVDPFEDASHDPAMRVIKKKRSVTRLDGCT
jgi:hypothetical protein